MMTFLKTVLIILLVYYGLKFLFKLCGPLILRYIAKKMGQRFEQAYGHGSPQQRATHEKDGNISVDKMPFRKSNGNTDVGEYVDYEEID